MRIINLNDYASPSPNLLDRNRLGEDDAEMMLPSGVKIVIKQSYYDNY